MIAAGQAQTLYESNQSKGPVLICNSVGAPRWHPLWKDNPAVLVPHAHLPRFRDPCVVTGGGHLPYLRYPYADRWQWADWRVRDHRPKLFLTPQELFDGQQLHDRIGPFILVEPTASVKAANRRPPSAFWSYLVALLSDLCALPIVQLVHPEAERLAGVVWQTNDDFRDACGVMSAATAFISTEGGLAHAAAALSTPSVILFGGCVSVEALGYPEHVNLVDTSPETPCGSLRHCAHCEQAWDRITPEMAATAVMLLLGRRS